MWRPSGPTGSSPGNFPSFVERLGTVASASCVPVADTKDVWADATGALGADPAEKCRGVGTVNVDGAFEKCPQLDMNNFCLRMRRFR